MNIICSLFPIPCGRGLETIVDNSDFQPRINEAPFPPLFPEGKVRQNWTTFSSPGFGIANFSFLAGKTSYLLITKLGLLTIKMLVLPRLSNFVQFHWTPFSTDELMNVQLLIKLRNFLQ
jgi:hypothetical protein